MGMFDCIVCRYPLPDEGATMSSTRQSTRLPSASTDTKSPKAASFGTRHGTVRMGLEASGRVILTSVMTSTLRAKRPMGGGSRIGQASEMACCSRLGERDD